MLVLLLLLLQRITHRPLLRYGNGNSDTDTRAALALDRVGPRAGNSFLVGFTICCRVEGAALAGPRRRLLLLLLLLLWCMQGRGWGVLVLLLYPGSLLGLQKPHSGATRPPPPPPAPSAPPTRKGPARRRPPRACTAGALGD